MQECKNPLSPPESRSTREATNTSYLQLCRSFAVLLIESCGDGLEVIDDTHIAAIEGTASRDTAQESCCLKRFTAQKFRNASNTNDGDMAETDMVEGGIFVSDP